MPRELVQDKAVPERASATSEAKTCIPLMERSSIHFFQKLEFLGGVRVGVRGEIDERLRLGARFLEIRSCFQRVSHRVR